MTDLHNWAAAFGKSGVFAVAATAASFALPDPAALIVFLGALGLGLGAGIGAGVAAYLRRTGKVRREEFALWEEATRGSHAAKLADALRDLAESRDVSEALVRDLASERAGGERLRHELTELAFRLARGQGHGPGQPGPPAETPDGAEPCPEPPAATA